ncbi:hypothetical protein [Mucilaginibacter defluvii]|uniref:Uncharacterized protein n=1 Tax=Mucilaginibacter defluvii TaxID=1196019 RepID=A0ABP9FQI4_9SPHI
MDVDFSLSLEMTGRELQQKAGRIKRPATLNKILKEALTDHHSQITDDKCPMPNKPVQIR